MPQKLRTYLYSKKTGNRFPATGYFLVPIFIIVNGSQLHSQDIDPNSAFEFWSRMNVRYITKKSIQHDVEFQFRNQQRVASLQERFTLYTFRWYIMKRFQKFYLQSSPVTFFERRAANGSWVNEFRLTQFIGWYLWKEKLQVRAGLEGRFFWTNESHFEELRLRTRLYYQQPLHKTFTMVLGSELFLRDRLSGAEVPVFDQCRVLAALRLAPHKRWWVEPGYQYQIRAFTKGSTDSFHVFHMYVNYTI